MDSSRITFGAGASKLTVMIGRAAVDLADDSVTLEVIVPQLMPAASGSVDAGETKSVIKTKTPDGNPEQTRATSTNVIRATYVGQSNLKYPPTIRRGEQVYIYQFGDSDIYYWQSMGRDPELRQQDVWRVEVSNKTDLNDQLTDDNTYFFELNTKTGDVLLKTSDTLGELARYQLHIAARKGTLTLSDDKNNSFFIDSVKPEVRMANGAGAMVDLLVDDVMVVAPQDIVLKAGRQIVSDAPVVTHRSEGGGGTTQIDTKFLTINASAGAVINGILGVNSNVIIDGQLSTTGLITAPSFTTGTPSPIAGAETTIADGGATAPEIAAPDSTTDPSARHAAAKEQLLQFADRLEQILTDIENKAGITLDTYTDLSTIAEASEMTKNTGE